MQLQLLLILSLCHYISLPLVSQSFDLSIYTSLCRSISLQPHLTDTSTNLSATFSLCHFTSLSLNLCLCGISLFYYFFVSLYTGTVSLSPLLRIRNYLFWIRIRLLKQVWIRILLDFQIVPDTIPDLIINIYSFSMLIF
jgi:hypothetical protein